jgi:hypothetical protein
MNRMEYITPSGNPPKRRIRPMIRPIPNAYIHVPFGEMGDVTISVAIKKAPIKSPPASIWNSGEAYFSQSYDDPCRDPPVDSSFREEK